MKLWRIRGWFRDNAFLLVAAIIFLFAALPTAILLWTLVIREVARRC